MRLPRLALLALLSLLALALRWGPAGRDGFSPDEEITVFAVRGISSEGAPRLPSGVLYERGVLYSYAAWAAGQIFGHGLPAYRLPSLLAGCLVVPLAAVLAQRLGGSALLAGLAACGATWLIVASTWARFYGFFVASFLATTLAFLGGRPGARRERWFLVGLLATRLLHEMGVALVALPLFACLQQDAPDDRRRSCLLLLRSLALLLALQLLLALLQGDLTHMPTTGILGSSTGSLRLAVTSIATSSVAERILVLAAAILLGVVLRRLRAPWLLCGAAVACAASLSLGVLWVVALGLWLARPSEARVVIGGAALASAATIGIWTVHMAITSAAPASLSLAWSLAQAGLAYPFPAGRFLVLHWPVAVAAAVVGAAAGYRRPEVRTAAFLGLACVVFLGATPLGPKHRYFLAVVPLLFALAALLPGAVARLVLRPNLAKALYGGVAALLLVALLGEHEWANRDDRLLERRPGARVSTLRTTAFEGWAAPLRSIPSEATLVCNDDLACLLAGRRADYWWLSSEHEATLYGMRQGATRRSVYTGARILAGEELAGLAQRHGDEVWLAVMESVKYGSPDPDRSFPFDEGWRVDQVPAAQGMKLWRARRTGS